MAGLKHFLPSGVWAISPGGVLVRAPGGHALRVAAGTVRGPAARRAPVDQNRVSVTGDDDAPWSDLRPKAAAALGVDPRTVTRWPGGDGSDRSEPGPIPPARASEVRELLASCPFVRPGPDVNPARRIGLAEPSEPDIAVRQPASTSTVGSPTAPQPVSRLTASGGAGCLRCADIYSRLGAVLPPQVVATPENVSAPRSVLAVCYRSGRERHPTFRPSRGGASERGTFGPSRLLVTPRTVGFSRSSQL